MSLPSGHAKSLPSARADLSSSTANSQKTGAPEDGPSMARLYVCMESTVTYPDPFKTLPCDMIRTRAMSDEDGLMLERLQAKPVPVLAHKVGVYNILSNLGGGILLAEVSDSSAVESALRFLAWLRVEAETEPTTNAARRGVTSFILEGSFRVSLALPWKDCASV